MDPLERQFDPEEMTRRALEARLARVWTCLPCIVESFNRQKMTVEVVPAINGQRKKADGTFVSYPMPKLVDIPVHYPGGAGVTFVFDIAVGDEVLVVFASRCIDSWWAQSGTGDAPEFRMHNLSDGFALPGIRSVPRVFAVDPGVARLRTDDDSAYFEFNPTAQTMKAVFPGGITLNGVTIDSNGNLVSPQTITGTQEVIAKTGGSAVHLSTHEQSGVQAGGANSGAPVPGS